MEHRHVLNHGVWLQRLCLFYFYMFSSIAGLTAVTRCKTPDRCYLLSFIVQSLSHVWLSILWTAACQASLSFTISQSLLKLTSIESVMPPNHLILCHPLLLLPSIFSSIRVFSYESACCSRWPKYWSFSLSISPSNDYSGLIPLGLTGLVSMLLLK